VVSVIIIVSKLKSITPHTDLSKRNTAI